MVSGDSLAGHELHDFGCRVKGRGNFAACLNTLHEPLRRKLLFRRQRCSAEYSRDDGCVGGIERLDEVVLEDPPPARLGAWFEDSPDSILRIALPQGTQ